MLTPLPLLYKDMRPNHTLTK